MCEYSLLDGFLPASDQALVRPNCLRPTLLAEDRLEFDAYAEVVLFALESDAWNGRFMLDAQSSGTLLKRIEAASTDRPDGRVTFEELMRFVDEERNHRHVLDMPKALHGILRRELLERVFFAFDRDGSGALDKAEWEVFLHTLKQQHLQYLLQVALQQSRAFFGRGLYMRSSDERFESPRFWEASALEEAQDAGRRAADLALGGTLPDAASDADASAEVVVSAAAATFSRAVEVGSTMAATMSKITPGGLQVGRDPDCAGRWCLVPEGWLSDLYYYSANNHPLHGMIACDPSHLLTRRERVCMELATLGYSLVCERLVTTWIEEENAPVPLLKDKWVFSVAVITFPSMAIYFTMRLLFTCPELGVVNSATASRAELTKAALCTRAGSLVAYVLLMVGLLFSFTMSDLRVCLEGREACRLSHVTLDVLWGRVRSYMLSWLLTVAVYFNLFMAWGQPDPRRHASCLGDWVGLGQWRIEKQRFRAQCVLGRLALENVVKTPRCNNMNLFCYLNQCAPGAKTASAR